MAKAKSVFFCTECGNETPKWAGRCPSCGAWNTLVEQAVGDGAKAKTGGRSRALRAKAHPIAELDTAQEIRFPTGMGELDRVLGGGAVRGSLVLVGGAPGIGKSTLLLQLCGRISEQETILYVSGEESQRQLKMRAQRLGVDHGSIYVLAETDLNTVLATIDDLQPTVLIVDSIQTMYDAETASTPGSISQVRECTMSIMRSANDSGYTAFVVGHINKEGSIAGPKVLEHMVDCVLYFEGDQSMSYRILRAAKNRFGSTNEIGVFEMQTEGLVEVKNPSEYMLNGRPEGASGSVVACSMEGTRPILIEIQALVCHSNFGIPRRTAAGCDFNRVNLLMAVLEKRARVNLSTSDAYVNIAGGIKMNEPAIDLGITLAVVSSYKDQVIDEKTVVFGEVGLSGEVRAVSMAEQRVLEAKKLGFERVILPAVCMKSVEKIGGIALIPVENIQDAILRVGKN